jgi:HEAT repeat protein
VSERGENTSLGTAGGSNLRPGKPFRFVLGSWLTSAIAAAAGCGVLFWVWKTTGDQDHREAIAAARALQGAARPADRVSAIRDLVRFGAKDGRLTIPPLIACLSDADGSVRVEAARALGPAACEPAFRGVNDAEVKTAIEALLHAVEDPEPAVRSTAVNALGSIVITESPSGLIEPDPLIAVFTRMLDDRDAMVRAEAIAAIGRAGPGRKSVPPPRLIEALHDESVPLRLMTIDVLTRFRGGTDTVLPHLIRGFERSGAGSSERAAYVQAIRKLRPPAVTAACVPTLVAALASPDEQLRFEVVWAIRSFSPQCRAAVPALIEIIGKQPLDLEKLGPGKPHPSAWDPACAAAPILGEVLAKLDDSPPDEKLSRQIIASLLGVLESGHPVRKLAAIGALNDGRRIAARTAAIPSLIRLMKKMESIEDPFEIGPAAANALSFISDRTEAAPMVIKVLRESIASHSRMSLWAIDALQTFGPRAESAIPDLIGVLEQSKGERPPFRNGAAAARALGEIGPGTSSSEIVVTALAKDGIASESKDTRIAAIVALARFGPGAAAAIPAIRARQETDPEPEVRRAAAGVLKRL